MAEVEQYTPRWPEDHLGRKCKTCGMLIYQFWADPEVPPPGTCPQGAVRAAGCPEFKSRMVNAAQSWEMTGKPPHPDTLALLERNDLDEDWARLQGARFRAFHEARDALGVLGASPITIGGKTVREWCDGEFSVERLAAILSVIMEDFDPSRGANPDDWNLTRLEIAEEQARCENLCSGSWPDFEGE